MTLKTLEAVSAQFAPALIDWYRQHGRHDLPWTQSRAPYHVWLSEIMLQQTQVSTVLGYYARFIAALPTLRDLAEAPQDQVLGLWTGLGYYSRARNLHAAAKQCVALHEGEIPDDFDALIALPGIGRSTAGAILSQAFDQPFPILDGNVRRVLSRISGELEWTGLPAVEKRLWALAERLLPADGFADYTQALMDLGATMCTRSAPKCDLCPVRAFCLAAENGDTARIPASRPKKTVPTRSCVVVWVRNAEGAHYLEKRPASGIWGALWSLPQFESMETAQAWAASQGYAEGAVLDTVRHVFTHFKLDITPVRSEVLTVPAHATSASDALWADADTLATLGIPAPIRKLLESKI